MSFLNELDAQLKKEFEWQQAKDGTEKKCLVKCGQLVALKPKESTDF